MSNSNLKSADPKSVAYGRSFLCTSGLCCTGVALWVFRRERDVLDEWVPWQWLLAAGVAAFGVVLLMVGVFAKAQTVGQWADRVSTHEASIILMALALPLYFVIRLFGGGTARESNRKR